MTCPRCSREMHGWPLKRADVCSPKDWASCIRWPDDALRKIAKKKQDGEHLTPGERRLTAEYEAFWAQTTA